MDILLSKYEVSFGYQRTSYVFKTNTSPSSTLVPTPVLAARRLGPDVLEEGTFPGRNFECPRPATVVLAAPVEAGARVFRLVG